MPDLDDILDEESIEDFSHYEFEDEKSNGNREVYINRNLIYSDRYIDAMKTLNEDRNCTKCIIESARKMLLHHHGDKYEDL